MAKLKVFRGTKADVDKKAITDGAVLVATDTSTLYVDANGKRLDLTKATTVDSALSSSSTNPVQSKAIVEYVTTEINKLETDKLNERLAAVEGKADDNETAIAAINVIAPKTVETEPVSGNALCVAIGDGAVTEVEAGRQFAPVAVGSGSKSTGMHSVAIGASSVASGLNSVSVGSQASANATTSSAIGPAAHSHGKYSVAGGLASNSIDNGTTAIGSYSQGVKKGAIAVGLYASAIGKNSVAVGGPCSTCSSHSVAIGINSSVVGQKLPDPNVLEFEPDTTDSVALGACSVADDYLTVSVGNDTERVDHWYRAIDSQGNPTTAAPFWVKKTVTFPDKYQHLKRRIIHVADPIDWHNAANKNYVDNLVETSKYVHPTTSGNKHIPSGGSSGQILRWSADGTAAWGAENDHTYGIATSSTVGLVKSGTDITVDSAGNVSVNNDSHTHGNSTITSVDASKVNSGVLSAERIPGIDASKITSGTISIDRLPAGALERLVTVKDQNAMYALTTSTVQLGDTVKRLDTGMMYIVVDTTKLSNANGYMEYTAGSASSVPWSGVTGKPSTFTPSSHTHTIAQITDISNASVKHATSADSATNDSAGQKINTTYIKGLSVSGRTITYTRGDNTTGIITTQDTNTTYSAITNDFIDTLF